MVQILPAKKPGVAQQLLSGAIGAAPEALAALTTQMEKDDIMKRRKNYYKEIGLPEDLAFAPESVQKTEVEKRMRGSSVWDKFNQGNIPTEQSFMGGQPEGDQSGQRLSKYDIWKMMSPEDKAQVDVESPQMARAFRERDKQLEEKKPPLREQPIEPEQLKKIQDVRAKAGFDELDELEQYRAFIDSGVSPVNAERESKLRGAQLERVSKKTERSYDRHKKFIDETTGKYRSFETEMKPKLLQMQQLNREELINPTAAKFLEVMDIPLGALDDPNSELFQKLSQDLLKGLPETYGSRILKVEVENFLKTIPQLVNSPEGRRMIASNMLKLGEMKETYYNEMRKQQRYHLDKDIPLPLDFEQRVFDDVKPQIDQINREFVQMASVKSIPPNHVAFFSPQGNIVFVPDNKEALEWAQNQPGAKRIW